MGCYNGTCGISGLPIMHGDEIVLFPLKANTKELNGGGYVYPWSIFSAVSAPLFGEYNDYGGIENITQNGQLVFDHFKNSPNFLTAADGTIQSMPDTIENLINNEIGRGEYKNIGFMMVRKDIYDAILEHKKDKRQKYMKEAKRFFDCVGSVIQNILKEVKAIENEKTFLENPTAEQIASYDREIAHTMRYLNDLRFNPTINKQFQENKFASIFDRYTHRDIQNVMMTAMKDGDLMAIVTFVEFAVIESALFDLRQGWMIMSGAGSQDDDVDTRMAVAAQTLKSAMQIRNRYAEGELYSDQVSLLDAKKQFALDALDGAVTLVREIPDYVNYLSDEADKREE